MYLKKIENINKELYFYLGKIVKVKKTNFLIYEHYNGSNNSCINGYKSCGKVNNKNFKFICVPENDECPIKALNSYPTEEYPKFGNQNYKTTQLSSNNIFIKFNIMKLKLLINFI